MSSSEIHETAIVHPEAKIGAGVKIGPYCTIGAHVEIEEDCQLLSHVVVDGHTTIGKGNTFYPFCSIGAPPQDLSYKGEPTKTIIGNNNVFRESVTVHRASMKQDQFTKIGDNCLMMAYVHVGHDAVLGNGIIVANSVNFAGHVIVGGMLSETTRSKLQLVELPLTSVTVSTMLVVPTETIVPATGLCVTEATPQLSPVVASPV